MVGLNDHSYAKPAAKLDSQVPSWEKRQVIYERQSVFLSFS